MKKYKYGTEHVTIFFNSQVVPVILETQMFALYSHFPSDLYNVISANTKSYFLKFCVNCV